MKKRLFPLLLAASLLCSCQGPAGPSSSLEPEEGSYLLYFVSEENQNGAALGAQLCTPAEGADPVDALLEALLAGPTQRGLSSPFPAGVELRRALLDEEGVLHLDFSEQYDALSGIQLTLANYCLTLTLTQAEGVESLSITVEGAENAYLQSSSLTAGQVILSGAEEDVVTRTAALWFPRSGGDGLGVEYRSLQLTGESSLSQALLEALFAGPTYESLSPLFPEGAQLLGCSLEGLERAFRMGVRAVNPVWNHANRLCGSCAEEPERGLTAQGRTFCRRMEALGMLVDVSHMSDAGFWDVAETLEGPFIASHSNARALCPHPRNLTDEMMREIIRRGGVAGINLFRAFLGEDTAGLEAVVAHIEHFLALGGEENVALGGDLDGCGDQFPAGFAGIQDMEQIVEALLRRNYREELLHAIFFDNLMRVVNQVCTM